jgi:hypothetical protein
MPNLFVLAFQMRTFECRQLSSIALVGVALLRWTAVVGEGFLNDCRGVLVLEMLLDHIEIPERLGHQPLP